MENQYKNLIDEKLLYDLKERSPMKITVTDKPVLKFTVDNDTVIKEVQLISINSIMGLLDYITIYHADAKEIFIYQLLLGKDYDKIINSDNISDIHVLPKISVDNDAIYIRYAVA